MTLGGRRVPVTRPRVRAVDGSGELPVASYELFTGTEVLGPALAEEARNVLWPLAHAQSWREGFHGEWRGGL